MENKKETPKEDNSTSKTIVMGTVSSILGSIIIAIFGESK